jgi:hypothetical protein
MRSLAQVALAVVVLAGCGAKKDLETLCRIADEVALDASIPDEQKMLTVMKRLEEAKPGEAMRNTMTAMAHVEPAKRWDVLARGADEMGAPDWKCEPMQRLLKPTAPVVAEPAP